MLPKSIFLKEPMRKPYFKEAVFSFYGFSLGSLLKERMRSSERDRGLFIQYLARKYAERALNQRSAPWNESGGLARCLLVARHFHFSSYLLPCFGYFPVLATEAPQAS